MRGLERGTDRGATAVLVAIVFVAVFIGFTMLVIDGGSAYSERRQLQNGADAGALAIAEDCVAGALTCTDLTAAPKVNGYANQNSDDNTSNSTVHIDLTAGTVTVNTSTRTASGGTILPPFFAQVFGLNAGTVRASAVARYGVAGSLSPALPLTFSRCEWDAATVAGTVLYPASTRWPPEQVVMFHTPSPSDNACPEGSAGADAPGAFGWLDTSGGCQTGVVAPGYASADTGRSANNSCKVLLAGLVGKVVDLPIYDSVTGTGTNTSYHIVGFAPFFLTGYYINGSTYTASLISPYKKLCVAWQDLSSTGSASDSCIKGFFTHDIVPVRGTVGTGANYGSKVVQLIG